MDKELRGCDAYQNLESTVRNMITSLRAVAELQNPAIRERHWEQLMTATKVSGISLKINSSNFELSSIWPEFETLIPLCAYELLQRPVFFSYFYTPLSILL